MPVGAYGGRRDLMEQIAPAGPIYQAGTLSGNPVAMAAGLAMLELIQAPGFHERLAANTRLLIDGLQAVADGEGIPFSTNRVGGMFGLFFSAEKVSSFAQATAADAAHVQPLLPRHAEARRLPGAVGVRGRLHVQRAHRAGHCRYAGGGSRGDARSTPLTRKQRLPDARVFHRRPGFAWRECVPFLQQFD